MLGELFKVFIRGAVTTVGMYAGNSAIKKVKSMKKKDKKDKKDESEDEEELE